MSWHRRPELGVFLILWASYAYCWQGRDWNSASRLMLTYAIVDRGTLWIDGLADQTRDLARYEGHWYTDKTPGFSVAAVPPYWLARTLGRLPPHPLDRPGFAFWPADYWVTLAISGLATAATGAILTSLALRLGCVPRLAALLGLTYGLATPAAVYATLAYGHQLAAFGLFGALALVLEPGRWGWFRAGCAGFLAAYASVVEIQVGPVSAILGLSLLALVLAGRRTWGCLGAFVLGASLPTALLLGYNWLAFDSPWRMGYFFLVMDRFKEVHSSSNPLGLNRPDSTKIRELLWGERRGLLWFAPVLVLTPVGLLRCAFTRQKALAGLLAAICLAIFLVNLSYPEWTGGWTTGPRLLVPLLPFACLAVAPLLAWGGRPIWMLTAALAVIGAGEMLLFGGVGGRVPDGIARPFVDGVWPLWRGERLPGWVYGQRFAPNLVSLAFPQVERELGPAFGWLIFAPLVLGQAVAMLALWRWLPAGKTPRSATDPSPVASQAEPTSSG